MIDKRRLLEKCDQSLTKERAIATGIGIFAAIFREGKILLRVRVEKGSLIYNIDLSGKWELPGGGVDTTELFSTYNGCPYRGAIIATLDKELQEEVCLGLNLANNQLIMLPAWLAGEDIVDTAYVTPLQWSWVTAVAGSSDYFPSFEEGLRLGGVRFFTEEEIAFLEIISPRMKDLITEAFRYQKERNRVE